MLNWPGMLEWDRGSITCSGVLGWDRILYLPVQWSLAGPVCSRWLWSSLGWCENQLYPCMVSSWCHRILAHSWTSWNSLSFLYIIESSLIPEHHKTLMDITEFSLILEHHRILAHSWISQNCRLFLNIIESLLIPKPAGSSIISRRRRIPELSSLQGSLYLTIEWGISEYTKTLIEDNRNRKRSSAVLPIPRDDWGYGDRSILRHSQTYPLHAHPNMGATMQKINNPLTIFLTIKYSWALRNSPDTDGVILVGQL